jgi:L-threonylcarbamoyladenylate synthase
MSGAEAGAAGAGAYGVRAPTAEAIRLAARAVREGGLAIVPTETVYGVAARADSEAAMARLYAAKGRRPDKPVARMLAGAGNLERALGPGAVLPEAARRLAERYWPGPLTLVLRGADGAWTGYRVPDHPVALAWLRALGDVVPAVTSANRSGEPAAVDAAGAWAALKGHASIALDGGSARMGQGSTVVRVREDGTMEVLREGPVRDLFALSNARPARYTPAP